MQERHTMRVLAGGLGALAAATLVAGLGLALGGGHLEAWRVLDVATVAVYAGVGVLVARRTPGNPIGWIFCATALGAALQTLAYGIGERWPLAAWYRNSSWTLAVVLPITFLLLLFPDGRLPSRRWRPIAWCAAASIPATWASLGLAPGPLEDYPDMQNPLGIDSPVRDAAELLSLLLLLVAMVGSPLALVTRLRRSRGIERAQLKWLASAGVVAAALFVVAVGSYDLLGDRTANTVIILGVLLLPLATGVAILRHRLYDVDVVVNRTLVYAALTALLAGVYLGSVLLLGFALSPLTQGSQLAVAGSTLAVAALFRPARARIQAAVDRRFFRRRYDASRTLERFGARLRDEVDVDALARDLQDVVADTVQPAHVGLWLRGQGR